MSRDIIVLTPNGRRQKVHCTPDTSILQVLEDVCLKHGFQPTDYDLKHHNHTLDLTTTIRFSNLPNKATLEMVEADKKRQESNVTIGLLLDDGERRTADFSPNTTLYDVITSLAPTELNSLHQPTIMYMRQEVIGVSALKEKTLRQLGLLGGRAVLRLLNKTEESKQANVSAVYRRPQQDTPAVTFSNSEAINNEPATLDSNKTSLPGPSNVSKTVYHHTFDPVTVIKENNLAPKVEIQEKPVSSEENIKNIDESFNMKLEKEETSIEMEQDHSVSQHNTTSNISLRTQENLERRLKIEEEVTFLGAQKAIAFMQPENTEEELEDLPDNFYELTIEEVRKLYKDLQQHRLELENIPLITSSKREELEKQISEQKVTVYKNVVVRIQFPDHIILQGIFSPNNTIEDITNFIKGHLSDPHKPFHIFTTPLKESLDPKTTLLEARFVPCVHMHFKWLQEEVEQPYLKEEIYSKQTSSDAASILASKYRAPSRRKVDEASDKPVNVTSTSKNSKVPKWFKK